MASTITVKPTSYCRADSSGQRSVAHGGGGYLCAVLPADVHDEVEVVSRIGMMVAMIPLSWLMTDIDTYMPTISQSLRSSGSSCSSYSSSSWEVAVP